MLDSLFKGLFDTQLTSVISATDFLLCIAVALLLGIIMAFSYMYKTKYTKSFVITLAILPAVVCVVIMMVNGNVGAGVAVAGAFSLVRFRSVPGTAKEIGTLFLAMASGLIVGMGYLGFSLLFTIILSLVFVIYSHLDLGAKKNSQRYKSIRIVIPEDLDYTGVFEAVLKDYTTSFQLVRVKTINMGSMFRLTYDIVLKDTNLERELINKLRQRNGNLEITVSKQETASNEL